jgi:hypothetical protein
LLDTPIYIGNDVIEGADADDVIRIFKQIAVLFLTLA